MTAEEKGRILLVDHSRGSLVFQETILRRREMQVTTALAGSVGLAKARLEKPQLIIFGYDLFDMSAPEFCREIRGDGATRTTSLLLVCDREQESHGELCLSAGCNDVIFKPLQRVELDEKVNRLTRIPIRRQLRTLAKIEVSLESEGRYVLGRTVNISSSGILLELEKMLPQDGPVRLHFYVPNDPRPIRVVAEVLRAEFSGGMARYGLRFIEPGEEEQQRIHSYVSRIRSRELI